MAGPRSGPAFAGRKTPLEDQEVQHQVARVESLLEALESHADPNARSVAVETVQALLDLYGAGLERLMDRAHQVGGGELLETLADDELVGHLLLVHGLHPVAVETRVVRALQEVRPYLESHGGNVELVRVQDGVAHLRLQGSCSGCPASAMTLKLAIEKAVLAAAPDLDSIAAEGVAEERQPLTLTFIDGPAVRDKPQDGSSGWAVAGGLPQLAGGGVLVKEIMGEPVLFLKLEDDLYAYRPSCPGCGESMERGILEGGNLACQNCGRRFDVRRAGRCLDAPHLYIEPIPLLVSDQGIVKIAQRSAVS